MLQSVSKTKSAAGFGVKKRNLSVSNTKNKSRWVVLQAIKGLRYKMESMKKGKFLKNSGQGLVLHHCSFATSNKPAIKQVNTLFGSFLEVDSELGSGPLGAVGSQSSDNAIFVGENKSTKSMIVNFSGEPGFQHLQTFLTQPNELLQHWKITSAFFTYTYKGLQFTSNNDITKVFEQIVQSQKGKKKKLEIDSDLSNTLVSTSVSQRWEINCSAMTGENFQVDFKIDNRAASKLWVSVLNGPKTTSHFKSVVASTLLDLVSSLGKCDLHQSLRTSLESSFNLVSVVQSTPVKLSPSLVYVKSSLKGVLNNLLDLPLSKNSQELVIDFVRKIVNSPPSLLAEKDTFIQQLIAALKTTPQETKAEELPQRDDSRAQEILTRFKNGELQERTALNYQRCTYFFY